MTLSLLAVWLLAVGVADLGRLPLAPPTVRRTAVSCVGGLIALGLGLAVVELGGTARLVLALAGSVLLCGWTLPPSRALRAACLGLGTLGALLAADTVVRERSWPDWLAPTVLGQWSVSAVLVSIAVVVSQVSTANLVVRMLLDAVGVPATDNEKQLRGGRVLGPMERVFLVCLGAMGEVTAAAIVVAAKGLLRFPELQRAHGATRPPPDGPSDVTEYFLIGSLASWLLALAGATVVRLAA